MTGFQRREHTFPADFAKIFGRGFQVVKAYFGGSGEAHWINQH